MKPAARWLLFWLLTATACQPPAPRQVNLAFYHWQTRVELSPEESRFLHRAGAGRLYVKFFDVDWDEAYGGPVPMAQAVLYPATYTGMEVVPCVFITNRSLQQLPAAEIGRLAEQIQDKLFSLARQDSSLQIGEVQIDCDWTESTREPFFRLLSHLRGQLAARHIRLSATIRLHQLRYSRRTGVPPVDYGVLMYYNMGSLNEWGEENSILNLDKAAPYLEGSDNYPLPLAIALPLFRWGVLYRDGRMLKLINNLHTGRLADDPHYQKLAPNRYAVTAGTFLEGHYLYPGDRLRLEGATYGQLQQAARQLSDGPWPDTLTLLFYHLDSTVIRQFSADSLSALRHYWE